MRWWFCSFPFYVFPPIFFCVKTIIQRKITSKFTSNAFTWSRSMMKIKINFSTIFSEWIFGDWKKDAKDEHLVKLNSIFYSFRNGKINRQIALVEFSTEKRWITISRVSCSFGNNDKNEFVFGSLNNKMTSIHSTYSSMYLTAHVHVHVKVKCNIL